MACKSCGEKKTPKDNCSFTKAVVEINNPETLTLLRKVVVPASLGDDETYPASVGKYCNVILAYEANEHVYIYSSDGIPTLISEGTPEIDEIWAAIRAEESARTEADNAIWAEIEEIEMSSDVVDIVGTYAELQQYDTTHLKDNDIIKVLSDETHQNETAYYRWSTATDTFSYVGSEGPYYTESEIDEFLEGKQDTLIAGANIQIAADGKTISATDTTYTAGTGLDLTGTEFSVDTTAIQEKLTAGSNVQINDNVISATDTTYTHFTGATSSTDGVQGLVPGPLAGDEDKYLKADGTWATVSQYSLPAATASTLGGVKIGANLSMDANDVLSATDTTYSDFVGTDGQTAGTAGLVPAPATTDAGKFLKADGTWGDAGSPINVVQTTGTSQADVMSQNATTSMVFDDPATRHRVRIGYNATAGPNSGLAIGDEAWGPALNTGYRGTIALGSHAGGGSYVSWANGVMTINTRETSEGYNNSNYRLLTGLYDGQSAHDAATYGQVISYSAINGAGAPTTATEGKYIGQLYYDTTNEAMYFLKSIDTTTTPATYTWEALGGGSSVNVVQTTGTSTTDVMSQNAVTSMVFADPGTNKKVQIGNGASAIATQSIAIGNGASVNGLGVQAIAIGYSAEAKEIGALAIGTGTYSASASGASTIAIGSGTWATGQNSIAIGTQIRNSTPKGSVAIGSGASALAVGEMNIGSSNTSYGYNSSNYRLLSGLYDPQSAHDAATKGYVDTAVASAGAEAFTTNEWEALWA